MSTLHTHHETIPDFGAAPTVILGQSGRWSEVAPAVGSDDIVLIESGVRIVYDEIGGALRTLGVKGELVIEPDFITSLALDQLIVYPEGAFLAGAGATGQSNIIFRDRPLDLTNDPKQFGCGILSLGKWDVRGRYPAKTFVRLAEDLLAGQSTLHTLYPTGWEVGAEIAVPGTIFAAGKLVEMFTVLAINGNEIQLDHPALFDHPCAVDADLVTVAKSVDETEELRGHVVHLNRPIVFQSENPQGTRGHGMWTGDAAIVDMRGVRFKDMGRTTLAPLADAVTDPVTGEVTPGPNQKGRYTIHFHHVYGPKSGLPADPSVDVPELPTQTQFRLVGISVTGDSKWPFAIHDSHDGLIKQCVGQGAGAGFVTEDGSESRNAFIENFGFDSPGTGHELRRDPEGVRGANFWLHGVHNHFRDNVGAGGEEGYGGYLKVSGGSADVVRVPKFPGANPMIEGQYDVRNVTDLPLLSWTGNKAYAHRQQNLGLWALQSTEATFTDTELWHGDMGLMMLDYASAIFVNLRGRGRPGVPLPPLVRSHNPTGATPLTFKNCDVQLIAEVATVHDRPIKDFIAEDSVFAVDTHMPISTDQQSPFDRTYTFRNVKWLPIGDAPVKSIAMMVDDAWSRSATGRYLKQLAYRVTVNVVNHQGVEGQDFRLWFDMQRQDFVIDWPQDGDLLTYAMSDGTVMTLEKGLTVGETWAKYGIGPLLELAPANTTTLDGVIGPVEWAGGEPPPPPPPPPDEEDPDPPPPPPPDEVWAPADAGPPFDGDATLRVRAGVIERLVPGDE